MNNDKYLERRKKIIKIIIPLFVIALIGIIIYSVSTMIYRNGKVAVNVVYAPYAATVKLNGAKIGNNATDYIVPGDYHLTVEFENFESIEQDIKITNDTKRLYASLKPINAAGEEYRKNHSGEFARIEKISGEVEKDVGTAIYNRWPILKQLPIKEPHYTIGYSMPSQDEAIITVQANQAFRTVAIDSLTSISGEDDLVDVDVKIDGLNSPFTRDFAQNDNSDVMEYLKSGYSGAMDGFSLWKTKDAGDYLYGAIRKKEGSYFTLYRFVLKKIDAGWQLCGAPYPILTGKNTPNVPKEILRKANTGDFN